MQKLLVSLRNNCSRYFFQQFDVSLFLNVFIRSLGVIFLISLGSILFQYQDLLITDTVPTIENLKANRYILNIFKIVSPIYFIYFLWISILFSICLMIGFIPFWAIAYNIIIYSSLQILFPTFLRFQWDSLLIEVAIFSLFLISPLVMGIFPKNRYRLSWLQLLPLILLSVRLFYHSGVVKILSQDRLWLSMTALDIHLFSQPMPHYLSYFFHLFVIDYNLSVPFVWVMFIIEIILPFALFIPSYRKLSACVLILFQCLIILTGNYGFFNFLTIVLLMLPLMITSSDHVHQFSKQNKFLLVPILVIICINSIFMIPKPKHSLPIFESAFRRLRICNNYGLFASLTTNQTKYNVSVSKDGIEWRPIHFHYFDEYGYPLLSFIQPYHPRIRWQLWFKFIGFRRYPYWYFNFIRQIAKDPNRLPTIVDHSVNHSKDNQFVKLCYENIMFDLDSDDSDGSKYWNPVGPKQCHLYSTKTDKVTLISD